MEEKKKKVVKKVTYTKDAKKKETKKEVKKEAPKAKSALPQEEPFSIRFKRFVSSYKFLYTAFGVLFVLVLLLAVMVFTKSRENAGNKSNIVFSIIEKDTQSYLDMDLETLVGKEYTLKVTNYRGNKMNTAGATYQIKVTNTTDVEIEVLKNNVGSNLITNQKETIIEGETFSKTEKQEVVYYFHVKDSTNIKAGDRIRIEVTS